MARRRSSAQGIKVIAERACADLEDVYILLVLSSISKRQLVYDRKFLAWLAKIDRRTNIIAFVCTGSALLAAAGLLNGFRTASNKRAFAWASSFGTNVQWQAKARWVQDSNRWTSSGIAAGIDMAAAVIREFAGEKMAEEIFQNVEVLLNKHSDNNPFTLLSRA